MLFSLTPVNDIFVVQEIMLSNIWFVLNQMFKLKLDLKVLQKRLMG